MVLELPAYGVGNSSTICRAELAAIAAAITHSYSHIASDSLISIHQTRKQLIYPARRSTNNPFKETS
eukprot:1156301-Pelagomonas_calceolata.AAC.3